MPNWSNTVPDDDRGHALPLIRTPATGTLHGIITSTDLIGCDTHFWGGHTVPCPGPDCEACQAGHQYRWHGYLSIYNPNTQLHAVLELTAQACRKLIAYRKEHDTLRGCDLQAYRWKHTRNGRVIIKTTPSSFATLALPDAPDLAMVMAIIWRIPLPQVFQAGEERGHPAVNVKRNGDHQSSDPRLIKTPNP